MKTTIFLLSFFLFSCDFRTIEDCEYELDNCNNDLEDCQYQLDVYKDEISDLEYKVREFEDRISDLESELENCKRQLNKNNRIPKRQNGIFNY